MMPALQNLMFFYVLTCLRQNALGSEIINGKDVPAKLMLYMASVQHNNRHRCGGFLVSEDFVVTAAHCDHGDALSVVLGTHNLKNVDDSTMRYSVTKCKHPDYKKPATGNDIMLLKLSKKVQLNNRVQPIQLPNSAIKDKAKCRVAGWGFTKTRGTTVSVLKKVDVSIVPLKDCRRKWESHRVHLVNTVICAGGSDKNKGFCNGDSGGPLVCSGAAAGIVSFNYRNNCDYPNLPNVYTDMSKHLVWIKNITRQRHC
ncbi:mast cell protease 1A-like isoform X2 [Parambassis ranga]|uniref:Granzyme M n=1 Tax=Parambassis ranga TaxID=210632 RepID=A0A6P7HZ33_9TELE|nr:mast cell protease 1A-like isoform X2 [Parambassis ranga]